eukprot:8598768-Alexandrium_andersonii.AAC.1
MVPSSRGRTAPASNGRPFWSPTGPAGGLANWRRCGGPAGAGGTGGGAAGSAAAFATGALVHSCSVGTKRWAGGCLGGGTGGGAGGDLRAGGALTC